MVGDGHDHDQDRKPECDRPKLVGHLNGLKNPANSVATVASEYASLRALAHAETRYRNVANTPDDPHDCRN